jgi:hypothetical protein
MTGCSSEQHVVHEHRWRADDGRHVWHMRGIVMKHLVGEDVEVETMVAEMVYSLEKGQEDE